jgi:DNA-binding PadR family transcriptional regulator
MSERKIASNQPLNRTEFEILLALADAQRHGYGIMQEVESRSRGKVRLGPGTLYGAIKRLLTAELIEPSPQRPAGSDDDPRRSRYYRLTRRGRSIAAAEAERLAELLRVAQEKRLLRSGTIALERGGV